MQRYRKKSVLQYFYRLFSVKLIIKYSVSLMKFDKHLTINLVALALSTLALIVSLVVKFPHDLMDFDYVSLLVSVLGILVTVLIGWQIADRVTLEKRIREIAGKVVKKSEKRIEKDMNATCLRQFITQAQCYYTIKDWKSLFVVMTGMVDAIIEIGDQETADLFVKLTKRFCAGLPELDKTEKIVFEMFLKEFQRLFLLSPQALAVYEKYRVTSSC